MKTPGSNRLTSVKSQNNLVSDKDQNSHLWFSVFVQLGQNCSEWSQRNRLSKIIQLWSPNHTTEEWHLVCRMRLWNRHSKVKIVYGQNKPWKSLRKVPHWRPIQLLSINPTWSVIPEMEQAHQLSTRWINWFGVEDKKAQSFKHRTTQRTEDCMVDT